MNIEQIAIGIKDANGLDMSDEAAITLLRRCLSKLAEHDVEPVAVVDDIAMHKNGYRIFNGIGEVDTGQRLYTEAQLLAAKQRAAEACAKVCENHNGAWIADVMSAIRNGDWRKYM